MAGNAPRQRRRLRQLWQCGLCNLQNLKEAEEFEENPDPLGAARFSGRLLIEPPIPARGDRLRSR